MKRTEAVRAAVRGGLRYRRWVAAAFALSMSVAAVRGEFCPDDGTIYPTSDQSSADTPTTVRTCDINRDGHTDLLTANDGTRTVTVLVNNGDGTFASPSRWLTGPAPSPKEVPDEPVDVTCCDVDGDGDVDLVAANRTADNVAVLFNDGNEQFSAPVTYPVGEAPWAVRCLPMDGDGHPDLVVANFTSDSVSVLINNGDGTFAPHVEYGAGDAPFAMALCDADGDGLDDVVTADFSGKTVSVLSNNGDGTLAAASTFDLGVNPFDVVCCDVDGINGPDIATANGVADNVTVVYNDGTGSFGPAVGFAAGDGTSALACCDLDGDQDQDVAAGNLTSDDLAILLNDGSGVFGAPTFLPVGTATEMNPSGVVCLDLEPDTDADVAVSFAGGVEVFENACDVACSSDAECDDGNPCTDDFCNAEGVCERVNNSDPCDDGNACTVNDACSDGVCTGDPIDCDDADACTADSCDTATGECVHDPIDCDDGDACTVDSCDPASGCVTDPVDCNDGVACTIDACDPATGCINEPDDASCDDGLFCTGAEFCDPQSGCVSPGNPCPEPDDCDEVADNCGCVAPTVTVGGPRYLDVTPAALPGNVALWVTGVDADVACVAGYVQASGLLGPNPVYRPASGTDGWNTVHVHGERLISSRTYAVQADCDANSPGTSLSPAAEGTTWAWADADNNTVVDITDIVKILDVFTGRFHTLPCETDQDCTSPTPVPPFFTCDQAVGKCLWVTLENTDLIGATSCRPDRGVSVRDVVVALDEFQGKPVPCTVSCP